MPGVEALGLLGFLVCVHLPILALCQPLVARLVGSPAGATALADLAWPSGRQLDLLGASLEVSLAATGMAGLLGLLAALSSRPRGRLLRGLPLALVAVPPYVHALAWSTVLFRVETTLRGLGLAIELPRSGPGVTAWVMAMSRLPLTYGMAAIALGLLPDAPIEAARSVRSDRAVLLRIAIPLAAPIAAAGLALAFLLSLLDYGVPALFQVNVLALGVFADYSASGDAARALAMAMPLVVLAAGACLALVAGWRRAALSQPRGDGHPTWIALLPRGLRGLSGLAMALVLLQAAALCAGLFVAAGSPARILAALLPARGDLIYSLSVALGASLLALGPALALAGRLAAGEGRGMRRTLLWLATLLPLAVPAPLFGIGLIALWRGGPLAALLPLSAATLPVLASAGRFAPLAAVLLTAQLLRRDPSLVDAARMHQAGVLQGWWQVGLPLLGPGLLAAAGLVFTLALGELGATLMVLPPGRSTLTARTFNYLHYGASEAVAGACLVLALATVLVATVVLQAFAAGQGMARGSEGLS
ncbi:MAG: hypothetical protein H6648_00860 [Caldilineae bacterium]|nr:hypothetical protein [Chloroflexota bacterium]MCB9175679.1 hypothetical protein [Caldilineae bacterium]